MPHLVANNSLIFEMNATGKLYEGSQHHILDCILFTTSMISKEGLAFMVIVSTEKLYDSYIIIKYLLLAFRLNMNARYPVIDGIL